MGDVHDITLPVTPPAAPVTPPAAPVTPPAAPVTPSAALVTPPAAPVTPPAAPVSPEEKETKADELYKKLKEIEFGMPADENILNIREDFLKEGKNEMKTNWKKFCRTKILYSSNVEVNVDSVYNSVVLKEWEKDSTDMTSIVESKHFEAENIFGKWPGGTRENITLLGGDPGSGKTFLMQIMFLSWLGLINVKFNKLEKFDLLLYMHGRNDRHESLKDLIRDNYPNTCLLYDDIDKVVDAFKLPGTRILYVVDGVDEQNARSQRLLEAILDQFSPDSLNTCLLTSRPHEVESIKRLLDDRRLSYQGCTITELTEDRQIKGLELIQMAIKQSSPSSAASLADVVECFKTIKTKSVFHHPLNIRYFFELYLQTPGKVATWTVEADVMHAMYNLYIQMTLQNLENNKCTVPDLDIKVKDAFAKLGQYSLTLFVNNKYLLTQEDFEELRRTCYEVSRDVDYKQVFSNILLSETDAQGKETGIYNFPHRSIQEHLQAMAVIATWEDDCRRAAKEGRTVGEEDLMAATLEKMVPGISGASDFHRYDKTIQFIILELLRTDRPRAEDNIKRLAELLRRSGVRSFQYWAGLVSGSRLHPVVVQEAAVAVFTDRWVVGPGEVEAADAILAEMKRANVARPALVIVDIPDDVATLDTVPSLLRTVGDVGGKMRLGLMLNHALRNYVPCDALLGELNNSPVLERFTGCLLTPGRVLAPLITPDSGLSLALTDPDHDLDRIRDRRMELLGVCLRCSPSGLHSIPLRRPLPRAGRNTLHLFDIPAGELEWPYRCLTALVPENKGYDVVMLVNCGLSNSDLDELRRRAVQTVAVSSEEGIEWGTAGGGAVEGWSTDSWGTERDWSDGTRVIFL